MIRFGISEYIRNFWFNLCIVLLLLVMMIISTILLSNIDEQTREYRLAEKYIDEDSVFLSDALPDYMEELENYGEILATQAMFCDVVGVEKSNIEANVYTEEVMKILKPRLDSGKYPQDVKADENTICALISHNPYGIKAGDTFTCQVYTADLKEYQFQVYVTGVISEGQRIYTEISTISSDMTGRDFFPLYSYEQTEQVRMIIPEEELKKLPMEELYSMFWNIIINLDDDISDEERIEIRNEIRRYQLEGSPTSMPVAYPSAMKLAERDEIMYKSLLMKYLPLAIIVILLFSICIVGIVTIKTARSTRYFGIMYTYGMQYRTAQLTAGLEMTFNCLMAFMATVSFLTLQTKFDIVGEINCNLDTLELLVMAGVCVITVVGAVLTTRDVLKEHTPVEILKNTI